MRVATVFILGNVCLMEMEKSKNEPRTGSWPNASNDTRDINHESKSLEEELERIIKLADNISEKAESAGENLLEKRPKGKRNVKKSALTSLVFGRSRTSLRSDKSSMKQPRLSPLAARAALAAAVTPLRQGSQTVSTERPQAINVLSAAGKASTSSLENEKKDGSAKKNQNTMAPLRQGHLRASTRKKIVRPSVKEMGSLPLNQYDKDIQLIVDIPIDRDNTVEKAVSTGSRFSRRKRR